MSDDRISPPSRPAEDATLENVFRRLDGIDRAIARTLPERIISAILGELRGAFGTFITQRFDRVDSNVTAQGDQTRAAIAGINVNPATQPPLVQPAVQRPTAIWGRPRFDTPPITNTNRRGDTDMPTSVQITRLVIGGVCVVAVVVLFCFYAPASTTVADYTGSNNRAAAVPAPAYTGPRGNDASHAAGYATLASEKGRCTFGAGPHQGELGYEWPGGDCHLLKKP